MLITQNAPLRSNLHFVISLFYITQLFANLICCYLIHLLHQKLHVTYRNLDIPGFYSVYANIEITNNFHQEEQPCAHLLKIHQTQLAFIAIDRLLSHQQFSHLLPCTQKRKIAKATHQFRFALTTTMKGSTLKLIILLLPCHCHIFTGT